jgi:hypothetical protein
MLCRTHNRAKGNRWEAVNPPKRWR